MTLTPLLKWAGGKRWLLPTLYPLWIPHTRRRLVEPFCGALSVALGLQPHRALLNDINGYLIEFYVAIADGLHISDEEPMPNEEAAYYQRRARFNALIDEGPPLDPKAYQHSRAWERARLFYYMNRAGFNGLCRFNRDGHFNVPFGRYKTLTYRRWFDDYRAIFKGWKFTAKDFERLAIRDGDFISADPPYDVEFTTFAPGGFTWDDQQRLAAWLADHPGPVVASNQATRRIMKLYRDHGFDVRIISAPRQISCTGDRTAAREMLATRNL